jgi:hypothetical protein
VTRATEGESLRLVIPSSHPEAAYWIGMGRDTGSPIPSYGTNEWLDLPRDDPRREAALWIAAECWWSEGTPERAAERLRDELAELDALTAYRIRNASHDVHNRLFKQRDSR